MCLNLENFYLSKEFGFLLPFPLQILPQYFHPWNNIAENLCDLIDQGTLRQEIHQMPILDHNKLNGYKQQRLAHLQLSMIAAGYVWMNETKISHEVLPKCVAVPLYRISESLGISPIFSFADGALCNWKLKDPRRPPVLENLQCIYNLPGGIESNWFFMVAVRIEIDFALVIQHIINGITAADNEDTEALLQNLTPIKRGVTKMKDTMKNLHGLVSAETFYNTLRPFLNGWGGEGSLYPDGIIYEGISAKPKQVHGSSAAQSPTLQCLDAALGVQHEQSDMEFILKMRNYIPTEYRRLINEIEAKSNIRKYVMKSENTLLKRAFADVIDAVVDFRSYHIQIVTKYIVTMSRRQEEERHEIPIKGTSGTNLIPFLKSIRKSTMETSIGELK